MYEYKYNKYKCKYLSVKSYQNGGEKNTIMKPDEKLLNFLFYKNPDVDRQKLLVTDVGKYSATGIKGSAFIVNLIKNIILNLRSQN